MLKEVEPCEGRDDAVIPGLKDVSRHPFLSMHLLFLLMIGPMVHRLWSIGYGYIDYFIAYKTIVNYIQQKPKND